MTEQNGTPEPQWPLPEDKRPPGSGTADRDGDRQAHPPASGWPDDEIRPIGSRTVVFGAPKPPAGTQPPAGRGFHEPAPSAVPETWRPPAPPPPVPQWSEEQSAPWPGVPVAYDPPPAVQPAHPAQSSPVWPQQAPPAHQAPPQQVPSSQARQAPPTHEQTPPPHQQRPSWEQPSRPSARPIAGTPEADRTVIVPGPGARPDTAPPTMFDRPAWEPQAERPPMPSPSVPPSPVPPSPVLPGVRPQESVGTTGGDRTVMVPPPQPGSSHLGSPQAEGAGVHEPAAPIRPEPPGRADRPGGQDGQDGLATQVLDRRAPGGVPAPAHGPGDEDPFDQDRTRADVGRQDFAPGQAPPPADPWQAPHSAEPAPYAEGTALPQSFEPQSVEPQPFEPQSVEQQLFGPQPRDPQQPYGPPPRVGEQVRYPGYGAVSATPPGRRRRAGRSPILLLGAAVAVLVVVVAIAFLL